MGGDYLVAGMGFNAVFLELQSSPAAPKSSPSMKPPLKTGNENRSAA
jgi:hypothetical protein